MTQGLCVYRMVSVSKLGEGTIAEALAVLQRWGNPGNQGIDCR